MRVVVGFSVELSLSVFAVCFCAWVLRRSWQCAQQLKQRQSDRSSQSSRRRSQSESSSRDGRFCRIQLTVFTNALYLIISVLSTLSVTDYLMRSFRNKSRTEPFEASQWSLLWFSTVSLLILMSFSLISITLIGFQRLQTSFEGTRFEIDSQTVKRVHYTLIFLVLINLFSILTYAVLGYTTVSVVVFVACEPLNVLLSVWLNVWVIRSFIRNSIAIAKGLEVSTPSRTPSVTSVTSISDFTLPSEIKPASITSHSDRPGSKLLHTSLRITLSCSIALLSSAMVMIVGLGAIPARNQAVIFVARWMNSLDWCLNTFGILCLYKQNLPYYEFVFGRLHTWLYRRMFES